MGVGASSPRKTLTSDARKLAGVSRFENYVEAADELQRRLDKDAELSAGGVDPNDPYAALPLAIRMRYSRAEYMWLTDADKATLLQRECEPDF